MGIDVKSVVFVPVNMYPCWPLTGVLKLDPVHNIKCSINVDVFVYVLAKVTSPFKLFVPVKVGFALGAHVVAAFVYVKYVLETSDVFK